jgi:hypothetical protein
MGPKEPSSTVLSKDEESLIVAFRKYTLLPLDDCLYELQESIPHLTRPSLHRCPQRHNTSQGICRGISRSDAVYQTSEELQKHLDVFIAAYNFAKCLKRMHGLTPYEFILKTWSDNPESIHSYPAHLNLGLYI